MFEDQLMNRKPPGFWHRIRPIEKSAPLREYRRIVKLFLFSVSVERKVLLLSTQADVWLLPLGASHFCKNTWRLERCCWSIDNGSDPPAAKLVGRGEAFARRCRFVVTKSERKCFALLVRDNTPYEFANCPLNRYLSSLNIE